MTVEERAENVMSIFRCMLIETTDHRVLTGIDLMHRIAQALRDQIEECAKENDKTAFEYRSLADRPGGSASWYGVTACERAAVKIRALAEPEKGETKADE